MTVVEREVVAPVVTERERRASILEAAALEIEVRGWERGVLLNHGGNVCLIGAMLCASDTPPTPGRSIVQSDQYASFDRAWGDQPGVWIDAMGFNDGHAETAAEVTFLLRWRAAEIRDGL